MKTASVEDQVRSYIVESFLPQGEALQDDDDLLTVLNSLQVLRMVIDLESTFGIAIDNSDLTPENIGSVENLAAFIAGKRDRSTTESRSCREKTK